MEIQKDNCGMLDLMTCPGFCVAEDEIVKVNQAAKALFLCPGTNIYSLLHTGREEYGSFTQGCLYLQLNLGGHFRGAAVQKVGDLNVFLLDMDADSGELTALALAARDLREPLTSLVAISDTLLPTAIGSPDEKVTDLLSRMSRGLYRMQRVLSNMSDAGVDSSLYTQESHNVSRVFSDIFEKVKALLEPLGIQVSYQGPDVPVSGLLDRELMERAVLNLISNSIKFMPDGGTIQGELEQCGHLLRFSMTDSGSGIADEVLGSVFSRYLRQPGLEDQRHGIGLGLTMVRRAASAHGGTVLIDRPASGGTRVTMTIGLIHTTIPKVNSIITDMTGGRDQALIELSEFLPLDLYDPTK